ncbi:MAG: hypothetical protein HQM16_04370 [Deltaproteobacteria bacterium]|nr:hypothetical protein [Deltaproteobacteria bacterium]
MQDTSYLKSILKTPKFDDYPQLKTFFKKYADKLEQRNRERFQALLASLCLDTSTPLNSTERLNLEIHEIEKTIQTSLDIRDFTSTSAISRINLAAQKYLRPFEGLYIKRKTAEMLMASHPLNTCLAEVGAALYKNTDPLFLISIARYSEPSSWNSEFLDHLLSLSPDDFEWRSPQLVCVDHRVFQTASSEIIKKKCFNTHDKITGSHIITTLPAEFNLAGKSPVLRTITKMIHYHREMKICARATWEIKEKYPKNFGQKFSDMLKSHVLDPNTVLFNKFEILEGLANREINEQIYKMAGDYPSLQQWAEIHNTAHQINGHFFSLSLWRLAAWHLNGFAEHTIKMYRDDILADMLIELYDERAVEAAVVSALAENKDDILEMLSRAP